MTAGAFALIDRNHQVVRSTDGFRGLDDDVRAAWEHRPELDDVLNGQADRATLAVGEASFSIDAVTDAAGRAHALLSASRASEPVSAPASDDPVATVRALLEECQAIAWVKDLAGRHLYVNRRCLEALGSSEDRLLGRTDGELAPHETVDGPRRSLAQDGLDEPEELEYTVPAHGARPALAAVRFAIRDAQGSAVAICGVAGPLESAGMVRDEARRMAIGEPSSQVDTATVHAELLQEWGLALGSPSGDHAADTGGPPADLGTPGPELPFQASPPGPEPAEDSAPEPAIVPAGGEHGEPPMPSSRSEMTRRWDEVVRRLQEEARGWQDEVDQVRSVVDHAEVQARQALDERDAAYLEGEQVRRERDELAQALAAERERSEELTRAIAQLRSQVAGLGRTLDETLPVSTPELPE